MCVCVREWNCWLSGCYCRLLFVCLWCSVIISSIVFLAILETSNGIRWLFFWRGTFGKKKNRKEAKCFSLDILQCVCVCVSVRFIPDLTGITNERLLKKERKRNKQTRERRKKENITTHQKVERVIDIFSPLFRPGTSPGKNITTILFLSVLEKKKQLAFIRVELIQFGPTQTGQNEKQNSTLKA